MTAALLLNTAAGRACAAVLPDHTLEVPPAFFDDWRGCFCQLDPIEWEPRGRRYRVRLTERDLCDLRSRATHYRDGADYDLGLRSSARATVKAVDRYRAAAG